LVTGEMLAEKRKGTTSIGITGRQLSTNGGEKGLSGRLPKTGGSLEKEKTFFAEGRCHAGEVCILARELGGKKGIAEQKKRREPTITPQEEGFSWGNFAPIEGGKKRENTRQIRRTIRGGKRESIKNRVKSVPFLGSVIKGGKGGFKKIMCQVTAASKTADVLKSPGWGGGIAKAIFAVFLWWRSRFNFISFETIHAWRKDHYGAEKRHISLPKRPKVIWGLKFSKTNLKTETNPKS